MTYRLCFISRNYRGVESSGNKAKTDNEQTLRLMGAKNLGLPTTYYNNKVLTFFLDLAGVIRALDAAEIVMYALDGSQFCWIETDQTADKKAGVCTFSETRPSCLPAWIWAVLYARRSLNHGI